MNFMYTICTEKNIGAIRRFILKLLGIQFVNSYKRKEVNRNED